MSHYQSAGFVLTGPDMHLILRCLVQIEQDGRRRGAAPPVSSFVRLKSQLEAAIAAETTSIGHEIWGQGYVLVSTTEYAERTGCSPRTAQRRARERGTRVNGQWRIPIKE